MKPCLKHLNKLLLTILLIMVIMLSFQGIAFGEEIYSNVRITAERLANAIVNEYGVSGIQYALISDGEITITTLSDKDLPDEIYIYTAEGVFVNEDGSEQLAFVEESNGKIYVHIKQVLNFPNLGQTMYNFYQYVKTEPNNIDDAVQYAWKARNGEKYYLANEHPHSQAYHSLVGVCCELATNEELPGYVGPFRIIDEYKAVQDVQIPSMTGRDLADMEILSAAGKEYLLSNDYVYFREKDMVDLFAGRNVIYTIQEDRYARWYTINQKDAGKTMTVNMPENVRGRFLCL